MYSPNVFLQDVCRLVKQRQALQECNLPRNCQRVVTVTAFATVGFPDIDEPTVNSQDELIVTSSGSSDLKRRSVPALGEGRL